MQPSCYGQELAGCWVLGVRALLLCVTPPEADTVQGTLAERAASSRLTELTVASQVGHCLLAEAIVEPRWPKERKKA